MSKEPPGDRLKRYWEGLSPEEKQRTINERSQRMKEKWKDPDFRRRFSESHRKPRKESEDQKRHRMRGLVRYWSDETSASEGFQKIKTALTGRKRSKEECEAISQGRLKTSQPLTEDHKEKIRKSLSVKEKRDLRIQRLREANQQPIPTEYLILEREGLPLHLWRVHILTSENRTRCGKGILVRDPYWHARVVTRDEYLEIPNPCWMCRYYWAHETERRYIEFEQGVGHGEARDPLPREPNPFDWIDLPPEED